MADVPGDKRRPVVVLTRERFIAHLNAVLVAPVTTNVRGIPTEVPLGPADDMPYPCAANFDNTFTLARRHFLDRITTLPPARLLEVCEAYRFDAGLDDLRWVLLDYGSFVVHIFLEETRRYYELERLWADVPRLEWSPAVRWRASSGSTVSAFAAASERQRAGYPEPLRMIASA